LAISSKTARHGREQLRAVRDLAWLPTRRDRIVAGIAALLLAGAAVFATVPPGVAMAAAAASAAAACLAGAAHLTWTARNRANRDPKRWDEPVDDAERHAFALAASLGGLVTLHDLRGHVRRIGGLDAETLICDLPLLEGRGFLDAIHVSDRLVFLHALDDIRQGAKRRQVELRFCRRPAALTDGAQFVHLTLELAALADEAGALTGILAQARESEESARLAEALDDAERRAESAGLEKTRFLAAVSHEMRTPLNAILGFSEMLSQEFVRPLDEDQKREYAGLIHESGEHLLALVDTMLDMSKIESGRYTLLTEPFPAAEAVTGVERMLRLEAERRDLTLTARVTRTCGDLHADRRAVQQILINLVSNAIKFTEPGGVVTIDAERNGKQVEFRVSDTGVGMSNETIARLGQPFVQEEGHYARRFQGTGLGLCLVKGLVDLHGGRMTVASVPGQGTSVTISLPADGRAGETAEPDPALDVVRPGEFPPRLNAARARMEYGPREAGTRHDTATAKTA
jgi:cell cycle sensor histidine kinase DivJ